MPDTRDINAFLAKLTDGADNDEERRKRIEMFARTVNAIYANPAGSMYYWIGKAKGAEQRPIFDITRDPAQTQATARSLAPSVVRQADATTETPSPGMPTAWVGTNVVQPDEVTERFSPPSPETPPSTEYVDPTYVRPQPVTDPRFLEQRRRNQ